jgi:hypothetical protein
MPCPSCASRNQSEFPVEMVIHPTGLKNVNEVEALGAVAHKHVEYRLFFYAPRSHSVRVSGAELKCIS